MMDSFSSLIVMAQKHQKYTRKLLGNLDHEGWKLKYLENSKFPRRNI